MTGVQTCALPIWYAYVRYNPLKYVDPDGLILFAFDGTGNDTRDSSRLTNVARFEQRYNSGRSYYVAGVGTVDTDRYSLGVGEIRPDDFVNGSDVLWYGQLVTGAPKSQSDMGGNYSGRARIDRMMDYFEREATVNNRNSSVMDIDIVGFSRGAAQAREFSNRITTSSRQLRVNGQVSYTNGMVRVSDRNGNIQNYYRFLDREQYANTGQRRYICQRVNYRFMGLWDTVLSTDYGNGPRYNLGIPEQFQHVAHAVAINEHRSDTLARWTERNPLDRLTHWGGFPLQSIGRSGINIDGDVRIEMGFLGAHADVGGGYAEGTDQLSQVPLHWMMAQATRAGLTMRAPDPITVQTAVLHDQSNGMRVGNPSQPVTATFAFPARNGVPARTETVVITSEDREVRGAVRGSSARTMGFNNSSMTNADTYPYISYTARNPSNPETYQPLGNNTGFVNMPGYRNWLRDHGYCMWGDACSVAQPRPAF